MEIGATKEPEEVVEEEEAPIITGSSTGTRAKS
jgi:hypothetical protein